MRNIIMIAAITWWLLTLLSDTKRSAFVDGLWNLHFTFKLAKDHDAIICERLGEH